MFFNLFKPKTDENTTLVFESALAQAQKNFPERFKAESESVEERLEKFEAISIFMALYAWYLKEEGSKTAKNLSQNAYDYMFDRFEIALREQGVADVRIGPEVKKLASAFHGRLISYGEAFSAGSTAKLAESFVRNHVCEKNKAMALSIGLISEAGQMQKQSFEEWVSSLNLLKRSVYEPRELLENIES